MSELKNNPVPNSRQAAQFLGVHPETFQNQTTTAQSNEPRRRQRYRYGTLLLERRKPGPNGENRDVWKLKIREGNDGRNTKRAKKFVGTFQQYPTRDDALRAVEHLRMAANGEYPRIDVTMRGLIDRYENEVLRPAFVPVGHVQNKDAWTALHSALSYKSNIKVWIRPRWEHYKVSDFKRPEVRSEVENWFRKTLWRSDKNPEGLAPLSVRAIFRTMRHLFKFAVKWGYLDINPLSENRVELPRGFSKRINKPIQLTPSEFLKLLPLLELDARVVVALAGWLGPRRNEIFGFKWRDFDLDLGIVDFVQGIVFGRITELKTPASQDHLPIPPPVLELLRAWHSVTPFNRPDDWVFASPFTQGKRPLTPQNFLKHRIQPAAAALGLPRVGYHSFRHSLNAWAKNVDLGAEQRKVLLRQSSTEVNEKYGEIAMEKKRELQRKIAEYVEQHSEKTNELSPVRNNKGSNDGAQTAVQLAKTEKSPYSTMMFQQRKWDYDAVERKYLHTKKSLGQIAKEIGAFKKNAKDPTYLMREILRRMHMGYRNDRGELVKLPYRRS